ncbi:MAG: aminotransferase class I/II-fold pyridoxal phosphate-dependent enzyme [Bacteroidia bacterium]|nr:aminotransferase class I/II-fold pyridoxal phosphate-dependent enzyme [Bacteroidia bacterium]
MNSLLKKIKAQKQIADELDIKLSGRKHLMKLVNNFANQYIRELPEAKSYLSKKVKTQLLTIKDETKTIDQILHIFKEEVTENGIRAASGGHIGYIPGGGIYASALADFLAAVSNEYAGVFHASPGAASIENEVINWLKKTFSYPETAVGNLASGGSISNLIALTAARDKHQVKNEKITKSVIYLSTQAHHCIQKALRIIGLEDVIIRYVPLDKRYRIDVSALETLIQNDIEKELYPFLVIASAGTTDVGAVDPLDKIATIATKYNLWFHVDAAYGGFFVLTSRKDILKGIEKSDSLVVDPHKGLFLPYGLGAVLLKDAKAVLHSNNYSANYMQDVISDDLVKSPAHVSPELTKHFRGLRLWLPLQLHGIKPFIACLEEKLLLTEYFRKNLKKMGFSIGPKPDLSVSYFWYPFSQNENEFNKRLMHHIHQEGTVFLSSTSLDGKFVIRMAILSFRTQKSTIDKGLKMIQSCFQKTVKEFKKSAKS